ncbi:MAG: ABC transporter substrate-binding protein [Paenibacillaceae bacterium]|nr:ABC transporter substrate-binding protein [Paenibacillaceae bacterium]
MGKVKGVALFALAAATALAAVGCSTSKPGSGASASPAGSAAAASPGASAPAASGGDFAKKLEIRWSGWLARGKAEETNKVQAKLEQKFNVKLVNKKFDNTNKEQVSLLLASGELPDATFLPGQDPYKLYNDQLTRTIPRSMIEKYAPNYAALLNSAAVGWKINQVPGKPNEYVALTGVTDWLLDMLTLQVYRLDWMEKLGIKPKGDIVQIGAKGDASKLYFTKEAFTLAEEEKMFDAFVNGDPDGNGKKDTFAVDFSQDGGNSFQNYAGAFGFGWGYNLEENGKVVEYNISGKYKELLKKLAEWYKKGYIDPEFPTLNRNKAWEKFAAGAYGAAQSATESAGSLPFTYNRPPNNLLAKDPNTKFLFAPPPIGPNGDQGNNAYTQIEGDAFGDNFMIRKDVSDEKLIRILQMLDYISFDKDAYIFTNFGEEGVDFTWEGEPNKSAVLPKWSEPERDQRGIGYYNFVIRPGNTTYLWNPQAMIKLHDLYTGLPDVRSKKLYRPYKVDRFNETNYLALRTKNGAKLDTIRDEFFYKAVIGEVNIDAKWDEYVNNWLNSGGKELLAELEKAPKQSDLSKK